jgi:peptide/nickel transport system ATP-binding protein
VQAQILELLKQKCRERRMSMVFITHDLALLRGLADKVALLHEGRVVECSDTEAFLTAPRSPQARALLAEHR